MGALPVDLTVLIKNRIRLMYILYNRSDVKSQLFICCFAMWKFKV